MKYKFVVVVIGDLDENFSFLFVNYFTPSRSISPME